MEGIKTRMHEIGGALRVRNSCASWDTVTKKNIDLIGIFAPASVIKELCILSIILRRSIFLLPVLFLPAFSKFFSVFQAFSH